MIGDAFETLLLNGETDLLFRFSDSELQSRKSMLCYVMFRTLINVIRLDQWFRTIVKF